MRRAVTLKQLRRENHVFGNTGGVSRNNRTHGFRPAFMDLDTGEIYLCRHQDGTPAPFHCLDGLPENLIIRRSSCGRAVAIKAGMLSGFERDGRFYTREEAATLLSDSR